jgi:urease accessory protein
MFVAIFPCDPVAAPEITDVLPGYIRAKGRVRLGFAAGARGSHLADLSECGGFRVKFPRGPACEAVVINTAGGMAGGDTLDLTAVLGPRAQVTVATQSAEKIYRSDGATTRIAADVRLEAGSGLVWAPQETILFNHARLARSLAVDMADDAVLLAAETVVFGRTAMGEAVTAGLFTDRWRVRRGGRLVFADDVRLTGDIAAVLARPAVGKGARAVATVLLVAGDAESRVDAVRGVLAGCGAEAAAAAWNGMLAVRALAAEAAAVRATVTAVLGFLSGRPLPRVWGC